MNGNFLLSFSLNSFEVKLIYFIFFEMAASCRCLGTSAFTTDDISGIWAKTREDRITRSCDSNAFLPAE